MLTEIRHALRRLRATPVVTLGVIACLTIGGWMTCIMSAIGFGIFRPDLRIPNPERVVQMDEFGLYATDHWSGLSGYGRIVSPAVLDSLSRLPLFAAVGRYEDSWLGIDGEDGIVPVERMTSGMMRVLSIRPALGRLLLPPDDTVGGVAVISYKLWQHRYGGDSTVIGRFIRLRGEATSRRIVGVMPDGFSFPQIGMPNGMYVPFDRNSRYSGVHPAQHMLARLADGVELKDAERVARGIATGRVTADREAALLWQRPRGLAANPLRLPLRAGRLNPVDALRAE